jgi:TnpA family transposase
MKNLALFRDHFLLLAHAMDELPLSDKATDYYATWLTLADHQQLSQFPNRFKAYLHLLAFIKHQFYQRQDSAVDVLLKSVSGARNTAKKTLTHLSQARKAERDLAIQALHQAQLTASEFANGVVAISRTAGATASEKYYKIETLVEDYLTHVDTDSMARVETLAADIKDELKNVAYYEILASLSAKLQRRIADVVRTVTFDAESSDTDLIAAIDHFKATDGRLGAHPPSKFLTPEEHGAVFPDDGVNTPLYKILLFIHMASGIKSGHLNLRHSYRYRAIQDYLISPAEWAANKTKILKETDLAEFADGEQTLVTLKDRLHERYRTANENFVSGENQYMSVRDDGKCRVRTPKTDYDTDSFISSTLSRPGIVPILQLLKSVDNACHFTSAFKHFSTKHSKMKPSAETLMAGIIAQGCNIGVSKLAKISTGLNDDVLRNTVNWYFDHENLRAANRTITSLIGELALANNYLNQPPALHSSSDGRKITVAVDCLHANYSFKYFGKDKGVTDYTFIDERQALFHNTLFSASDREAPYVIDGLLDNQVPRGHVHSTDTHGFTEQIFCTTHLMGIAFAPRLANLGKHRLYAFSSRKSFQRKGYSLLPSRTINQKLILSQWDNVLRFMATIKTRRTTASQLFKRLSSYALDHPLYRALKEFGRIIKSQFILTYFDDAELRQRIEMQLSRVEQANKFSAAVFFDHDHAFQDGSLHQQEVASTCKQLLQNAVILWNYLSLSEHVINTPSPDERRQIIDAIRRGSVITWTHVNMRGEYTFTPPSANDEVFDIRKIKAFQIN